MAIGGWEKSKDKVKAWPIVTIQGLLCLYSLLQPSSLTDICPFCPMDLVSSPQRLSLPLCPEAAVLTPFLCPFAMHSDIHSPGLAHSLGLSAPLRRQSGPEFPGQGCLVPENSEEGW